MQQKIRQLESRLSDISCIMQVVRTFDNILDIQQIGKVITQIVLDRLSAKTFALFIVNHDENRINMVHAVGFPDESSINFSFPVEDDLLWQAIRRGLTFQTKNDQGRLLFPDPFEKYNPILLKNQYLTPLIHQQNVVGLIGIGKKKNNSPYSEDDLKFLAILADRTAAAITIRRLYEKNECDRAELDKMVRNLSILYNIGRAMIQISDLKNLVKFILDQAIKTMNAQKGSLMLYDEQTKRLMVRVVRGLPDKAAEEGINSGTTPCATFAVGEGIAGQAFFTKQPIIVNSPETDTRYKVNKGSNVTSILCLPLIASDEAIGVINITNKFGGEHFTSEDLELLTALGNQAAVAINKATLHEMATTDELTSLHIRRYFNVKLNLDLKRAQRYRHSLSLALCDLDHFKSVNDAYGHRMGDAVLQAVAQLLVKNLRDTDSPSRFGGEEFAVILPETGIQGAAVLCERIRRTVEGMTLEGLHQKITISIGIAAFPQHASTMEELIDVADKELYRAKNKSRNRVCYRK